jgi:photosystem II stability/assembly factor-like uncharacterized protein
MSNDLESELRDTLHERATAAPDAAALTERVLLSTGSTSASTVRRHARPGWLLPVMAACVVLIVIAGTLGAVALFRSASHHESPAAPVPTPSQLPTPSVPAPHSSAATAPSGSASGSSPAPVAPTGAAGGPVPAGFRISDMTFVSSVQGWALGTAPCAAKPCTSLVRTVDGGRTWAGIRPPVVGLTGMDDCITACVTSVRFATPLVGYLFGPRILYSTMDGGATWQKQDGGAEAVEIANGTAMRVADQGCVPGCGYRVSMAPTGSGAWRTVLTIPPSAIGFDTGVSLARTGSRAFVMVYGHVAGGAPSAHSTLYSSTDGGATWTKRGEPCPQSLAPEVDATALTTADDGSVAVLCTARSGGASVFATSTDGAATFRSGKPLSSITRLVGAASASVVFVATEQGTTGISASQLVRSADGGLSWNYVTPPVRSSGKQPGVGYLGFENATTGRWVPYSDPSQVWTTSDGGASWTPYRFR